MGHIGACLALDQMAAECKGTKKLRGLSPSEAAESQEASGEGLGKYIPPAESLCRSCCCHLRRVLGVEGSGDVVGENRNGVLCPHGHAQPTTFCCLWSTRVRPAEGRERGRKGVRGEIPSLFGPTQSVGHSLGLWVFSRNSPSWRSSPREAPTKFLKTLGIQCQSKVAPMTDAKLGWPDPVALWHGWGRIPRDRPRR